MVYNFRNLILLVSAFSVFFNALLSAEINEKDRELNKNIRNYIPVYSTAKRIPWHYWSGNYKFVIDLINNEKIKPNPPSDLQNTFLGYRNKETKIKITCYKIEPPYNHIKERYNLGTFNIREFDEVIPFRVRGMEASNELEIRLSVKRDKLNIGVVDSGKMLGLFKKYSPMRVFLVDMDVRYKDYHGVGRNKEYSLDG